MYNVYLKIKPETSTSLNIGIVRKKTQDNCDIIYVLQWKCQKSTGGVLKNFEKIYSEAPAMKYVLRKFIA